MSYKDTALKGKHEKDTKNLKKHEEKQTKYVGKRKESMKNIRYKKWGKSSNGVTIENKYL